MIVTSITSFYYYLGLFSEEMPFRRDERRVKVNSSNRFYYYIVYMYIIYLTIITGTVIYIHKQLDKCLDTIDTKITSQRCKK